MMPEYLKNLFKAKKNSSYAGIMIDIVFEYNICAVSEHLSEIISFRSNKKNIIYI